MRFDKDVFRRFTLTCDQHSRQRLCQHVILIWGQRIRYLHRFDLSGTPLRHRGHRGNIQVYGGDVPFLIFATV